MSGVPLQPKRLHVRELGAGHWLRLDEIEYVDRHRERHVWEVASRCRGQGAVVMIPRLSPSERFVLISQYRPALDRVVLEFPAGLIDAGESASDTAIRELREETGYHGTVQWLGPASYSSPGMSGEAVCLALMQIDEQAAANRNPVPAPDTTEDITVRIVAPSEVQACLRQCTAAGLVLDSKVAAFFLGCGLSW